MFPIEEVSPADRMREAMQFKLSIEEYTRIPPNQALARNRTDVYGHARSLWRRLTPWGSSERDDHQVAKGHSGAARWQGVERDRWEERADQSAWIAGNAALSNPGTTTFKYNHEGTTAGIIVLFPIEGIGAVEIAWLSVHPAVNHVGSMLVAKAINFSKSIGFAGDVIAYPQYGGSSRFFKKLEFEWERDTRGQSVMRLYPENSNYWRMKGDVWRFKEGAGDKYIAKGDITPGRTDNTTLNDRKRNKDRHQSYGR